MTGGFLPFMAAALVHLAATAGRCFLSIGIALAAALPPAVLLGRRRWADRLFRPLVYVLYTVPKISLFPLALLLFGLNDRARVAVVALVLFFQFLIAVRDGIKSLPESYFLVMRGLGAGRLQRLAYLVFPAVLPRLLTALRIGSAAALSVLFFTETSAAGGYGLGKMCVDAWAVLDYRAMAVSVLLTILLGFGFFFFFRYQEKRFCRS